MMFRMDNASWTAFLSCNISTARKTTLATTTRECNTTRQEKTQRKHNLSQTHEQQKQQERKKQLSPSSSPIHEKVRLPVKLWDTLLASLSRHRSKTDGSLKLDCLRGNCFGLRHRMSSNKNVNLEGEQSELCIRGEDNVELGRSKSEVYNTETGTRCAAFIPLKRSGAIRGRKTQVIKTTLNRSGAIRGRKPRIVKTSLKRSGAIRGRKPRNMLHCVFAATSSALLTITSTTRKEILVMSADLSSEDVLTVCDKSGAARPEEAGTTLVHQIRGACSNGLQHEPLPAQYDDGNHYKRKDDVSGLKPSAWMKRARPGVEQMVERGLRSSC